jgi:Dolichyl-phosphate-mannose-protein mannosyltransferase
MFRTWPPSGPWAGGSLLDRTDVVRMMALVAVGLAIRLYWYSGYGLGDDTALRRTIESIVLRGAIPPNAYGYRVTWWLPTAALCQLIGIGELGLIAPITAMAMAGIALVYTFGKHLYGRPGALIAASLVVVNPLDVAWSTMLANDVYTSFFQALCVLYVLRATEADDPLVRQRRWLVAAFALFVSYHAKASALALVPALLIIAWWRRDRLGADVWTFVGVAGVFFALDAIGSYGLSGSPIGAYNVEMRLAGLWQADALIQRRLTTDIFLSYPRWLFWRDHLGGWLYAGQPTAIVLLAVVSPWLGIRTSREVLVWFLAIFCASEFQMTRYDGVFVTVFRNIRHSHPLVYPVALLLAGYLVSLRSSYPRVGAAVFAVLVGFGLWASAGVAGKTAATFADEREVSRYLSTLPPKPVYADFHLVEWYPILNAAPLRFRTLDRDPAARQKQLAAAGSGYVVTGGGREPYYGCWTCMALRDELPPGRVRLLKEFPGPEPPTPWRSEAARVWDILPKDAAGH